VLYPPLDNIPITKLNLIVSSVGTSILKNGVLGSYSKSKPFSPHLLNS